MQGRPRMIARLPPCGRLVDPNVQHKTKCKGDPVWSPE